MGTPEMAAHILERILAAAGAELQIVAVVTRPDQPSGRGLKLRPSDVAAVAARHRIPTLKPVKLKGAEFATELKSFAPDLLVVAAYGRILPAAVLAAARIMPINVHASLLPRHRGAAPIEGAILAGDADTGVTIMRVTEAMDAGPVLARRAIAIAADDTQATLKAKLADLGADLLLETLARLRRGELTETPQDDSRATYTKPVEKSDSVIDWRAPAVQIERMTRAYDPWPVARTTLGANELLVHRVRVIDRGESRAQSGTVVRVAPNPVIQCGEGLLELVEVQAAGRKRMGAAEFARGRRLAPGARLGD
jgi:methionyl-tRNA formyltransferase